MRCSAANSINPARGRPCEAWVDDPHEIAPLLTNRHEQALAARFVEPTAYAVFLTGSSAISVHDSGGSGGSGMPMSSNVAPEHSTPSPAIAANRSV